MHKPRKNFQLSKLAVAITATLAAQSGMQLAHAGAGWGDNLDFNGNPIKTATFYANSPSGWRKDASPGAAPNATVDTGKALRKFVDTLPGLTAANANNLGQYLPLGSADTASYPGSDYYEIAVVEYTERMHSDLAKATTLRGYVQLTKSPAGIPLFYPAKKNGAGVLQAAEPIMIQDTDAQHNLLFTVDAAGVKQPVMVQAKGLDNPHYLGPIIVAGMGRAVRMKFVNLLPAGGFDANGNRNGDLFLPVDTTLLGAGVKTDAAGNPIASYTQNRAEVHLHGGDNPWISDGTPHQWITPAGEVAPDATGKNPVEQMLRGASTQNVPDMPDPGPGASTYYFPNNQSARLMFYHDHASGLTRLNVYAGEAAGYVLTDAAEASLYASGALPGGILDMIPLVIQDKTFVPKDIAQQDGRWDAAHWGQEGDLWFPHVYETNQDPNSFDGTNPVGRWDYGPWFWPVFPVDRALPSGTYGDVSTTPEAFMDTPVVNGTAYPRLEVDPKAYRFRILNAANDRFLNLGLYVADATQVSADGRTNTEIKMVPASASASANAMLPACAPGTAAPTLGSGVPACWPDNWPVDNRTEGTPDPRSVGPDIVVIGNEGGFLPQAHVIPSSPIVFELNRRSVTVLNVLTAGLYLGNAERADAVIDFSQYAGKTLILYNDAPAPVPAFDPRIDYYTDNGDQTGAGGAESTKAGYGPNTRTVMQIKVAAARKDGAAITPFNVAKLEAALPAAYAVAADRPVVGQAGYNKAFGSNYSDNYAKIRTGSIQQPEFIWTPTDVAQNIVAVDVTDGGVGYKEAPAVVFVGGYAPVPGKVAPNDMPAGFVPATAHAVLNPVTGKVLNIVLDNPGSGYTAAPQVGFVSGIHGGLGATASVRTNLTEKRQVVNKAIQELFDPNYGRMNATLGIEMPFTSALNQTTVPLGYIDSTTEFLKPGETQIWKITHNGVDTHPVHFHLMNVQLVNRVGWDGTIKPPTPSEMGWKETIKMNPLEDIIVAVSPKQPLVPFGVPHSTRLRDPSQALNANNGGFTQVDLNATLADGVTPNPSFGLTLPANTVRNVEESYEWEYVWHCHILGHEENDFMRPVVFRFGAQKPDAPISPTATATANVAGWDGVITWTDPTPGADANGVTPMTTMLSKKNEISFVVERYEASDAAAPTDAQWTAAKASYAADKTAYDAYLVAKAAYETYLLKKGAYDASVAAHQLYLDYLAAQAAWAAIPNNPAPPPAVVVDTAVLDVPAVVNAPAAVVAAPLYYNVGTTLANATTITDNSATAATSYWYRVIAHGAVGDTASLATPMTTGAAVMPPAPTSATATLDAVLANTVNVTWVPDAVAPTPTAYIVKRCVATVDAGGAWSCTLPVTLTTLAAVSGAVTTYQDKTLASGVSYVYQIFAQTAAGVSTVPAQTLGVTTALGVVNAPNGMAVTAGSDTTMNVSWVDNSLATNNEVGFQVQRSQLLDAVAGTWSAYAPVIPVGAPAAVAQPGGAPAIAITVGRDVRNFVDTGLTAATSYKYQVAAVNGAGMSAFAPEMTGTTMFSSPAMVANSVVATPLVNQVTLTWPALENSTSFKIVRTGGTGAPVTLTVPSDPAGNTYVDLTVAQNTVYSYAVQAVNGPNAPGAAATAQTVTGFAPASLMTGLAQDLTGGLQLSAITLKWDAPNPDYTTGVRFDRCEQTAANQNCQAPGSLWTIGVGTLADKPAAALGVASPAVATSWTDNTVLPSKTYSYRVNFVNGVNASAQVLTSASTQVGLAVGAPSNLVANLDVRNLRNTLTWIDNANNETSFVVERSVDGVNFSQIATPSAQAGVGGVRTASDTAIAPGVVYTYRVKAVNVVGAVTSPSGWNTNGAQSVDMRIAKPVVAAGAPTSTSTVLTWTESNPWVTSYDVYRSSDNGTTWALLGNTTAKTYTDSAMANLVPENAYQYRVSAKWLYNAVTYPQVANEASTVGVTTAPATLAMAAPANVTSALAGLNRVTVSWADNANNETAYEVYRSANGGAYTLVGTPAHTGGTNGGTVNYTDTSASTLGDSYTYQVRGVKVTAGNVAGAITPTAAAETRYSAMSAASATPLLYAVPPMPVPVADNSTARSITISWTPVDRATGYIIERQRLATVLDPVAGTSAASAQGWATQNTVNGGTSASWTNTGLTYGRKYQYRVRATSVLGDSSVNTAANVTAEVIVK